MKKVFTLLFLLVSLFSNAQIRRIDTTYTNSKRIPPAQYHSQTLYSYTVGFKIFSLEEFPKILNQVHTNDYVRSYVNGIMLKYNDNQISYRMSGSFFSDNISFKNECEECELAKGKVVDNAVKIGFEKNFIYAAVQPYFGIDLGFRRNTFDGTVNDAGTLDYTTGYDANTTKNSLSFSPVFGIKLNLVNHFTLAAETGLDLLYSYERQEKTLYDNSRTRLFSKFNKWEFLLKPVSILSLQYNFGVSY